MIKTTMSTNINPAFSYLLSIDKPVEACASTFVELYKEAIECIIKLVDSRRTDILDIEDMDEQFETVISMMLKLNDMCIYQFVDTYKLADDLRQMYYLLHVQGYQECMAILDSLRGRPQERYSDGSDEDPDLEDMEGPLDFKNPHTEIPRFYTPEFNEYTNSINARIKDNVDAHVPEGAGFAERNRALKQAIGEATLEYPLYSIHRIFAGIVVPAGHIDDESHNEDNKQNNNPQS